MKKQLSQRIISILHCSYCSHELQIRKDNVKCSSCGTTYTYDSTGSIDLRLKKQKKIKLEFELGDSLPSYSDFKIEPLMQKNRPDVNFTNANVPHHLTNEILSYFPKAKTENSLMLDLGCGGAIHKSVCECAGFEWVGLDYDSPKAPILGDGHALPFKSESFEFILSVAVLEHIRYPFIMMKEAFRVLKNNGVFIGTVAFLEPFHGESYYHHSHMGTINSLLYGGFKILRIAPSTDWTGLKAQANMSLFYKMPQMVSNSIIYPIQLLHRLWWHLGRLKSKKLNENLRIRNTTGSFSYVAIKAI